MAGKPKSMRQIKQLILLHQQGRSIKFMARTLKMSKNTVKEYLAKLKEGNYKPNDLLALEDPELERKLHAGNPAYSDPRFDWIKNQLDYYAAELKRNGVTRKLLWEEYAQAQPQGYQYTQFCYHLNQHLRSAKPSMVLSHEPGDKLYIDFAGKTVSYVDQQSGEQIACQLFVACLPHSDYGFVIAVPSQKIEDFIYALMRCLEFLGGVPAALVPDNLKSAVAKPCKYEPTLSEALDQLANHYKIQVIPARPGKPKDKALVENHVRLIYQRVLAPLRNQVFFSLHDLNQALFEQNRRLNQTRMQQKNHTREEKFLAAEKALLKPLPPEPFELARHHLATVQKNNHVLLSQDKHYYSVPYKHLGQKATIIYTRSLVSVFVKGEKVATHPRDRSTNGYSTVKEHLCSHHQHYGQRSPQYYQQRAKTLSDTLHQLITLVFTRPAHPEQWYKTCDGLLRLQRCSDPERFEKACTLAIAHEQYSYRFVSRLLENNLFFPDEPQTPAPLPSHGNVRGADYYHQLTLNFKSHESD
jgi:transposase